MFMDKGLFLAEDGSVPKEFPFMSRDPSRPDQIALDVLLRIDARCVLFEAQWKAGHTPLLIDFLGAAQGEERSALLRELLRVELHYRRRSGETPTPQDYFPAFPA